MAEEKYTESGFNMEKHLIIKSYKNNQKNGDLLIFEYFKTTQIYHIWASWAITLTKLYFVSLISV